MEAHLSSVKNKFTNWKTHHDAGKLTCFTGNDWDGWRSGSTADIVHADDMKLILGVGTQASHHIEHGNNARSFAESLESFIRGQEGERRSIIWIS